MVVSRQIFNQWNRYNLIYQVTLPPRVPELLLHFMLLHFILRYIHLIVIYLNVISQIRRIMRPTDVPDTGLLCDLLWADPDKDTQVCLKQLVIFAFAQFQRLLLLYVLTYGFEFRAGVRMIVAYHLLLVRKLLRSSFTNTTWTSSVVLIKLLKMDMSSLRNDNWSPSSVPQIIVVCIKISLLI